MTEEKTLAPLFSGVQEKLEDLDKCNTEATKREIIPGTRQLYTHVQALATTWPDLRQYSPYTTQS